jgi:ParB/RepB/Spo0J family partition protein
MAIGRSTGGLADIAERVCDGMVGGARARGGRAMKPIPDKQHTVPISEIRIGERHRRDLGDITGLAASIDEVGLLHPVVIRGDGTLIAGERRLRACQSLGWVQIPVTAVDLADIVRGELHENAARKDFLPSEIDAIRRALEPQEKAAAKERQGARNDIRESFPDVGEQRVRDKIGAFAGVSGRTVEKIAAVIDAAAADPIFRPLVEKMDETGRVNGIYQQLKMARQAASIRNEAPPLPGHGPYRVIVCDPPWPYIKRTNDPSHRGASPYPSMTIDQICAVPVGSIAHGDCVLWLWTTNVHLITGDALKVLNAWGFEPKTMLTWAKSKFGTGDWLRGQTEHSIMAVRGRPTVALTNQTTLLNAEAGAHSAKPRRFYELVESLCPAPRYATLFHRGSTRPNWDGHGDEITVPLQCG